MAAFEGWSALDVLGIVGLMLLMVVVLIFNRQIAGFVVDSSRWTAIPPIEAIREDRPDRLTEIRESRRISFLVTRWGLIDGCTAMLIFGGIVLIAGRDSGLL